MPARLLIVRLGAMGDILHALPAVALLRSAAPEARIGWVVERRWSELLCAPGCSPSGERSEGRPMIDELHRVDTRGWRRRPFRSEVRREFFAAVGSRLSRRYDAALAFQAAIKSAQMARLSPDGRVVGFRHPREALARWLYHESIESSAAHVIGQNRELARSWLRREGCNAASPELPSGAALLPRDEAAEESIAALLDSRGLGRMPFAILNPGAGWGAKQWPAERYGELALRLGARGMPSVVNYGPGEEKLAGKVAAGSQGGATALCPSLSQLIALTRRARLFVGGDTGPLHLAALIGVPTVALFGPTDPARNGPYWPSRRVLRDAASILSYRHERSADPGLARLGVAQVLEAIYSLLA